MKESRPDSASEQRPGSGTERPTSASRARTDSITTIEVSRHPNRHPCYVYKVTFLSGVKRSLQLVFPKYLEHLQGIFLANTQKIEACFQVSEQRYTSNAFKGTHKTILSCRTRRKTLKSRGRKCRKETPASWTASGWKLKTKRNFKTWLRSKQISEPAVTARC